MLKSGQVDDQVHSQESQQVVNTHLLQGLFKEKTLWPQYFSCTFVHFQELQLPEF